MRVAQVTEMYATNHLATVTARLTSTFAVTHRWRWRWRWRWSGGRSNRIKSKFRWEVPWLLSEARTSGWVLPVLTFKAQLA